MQNDKISAWLEEVTRESLDLAARYIAHELPNLKFRRIGHLRRRIANLRENDTPDEYLEGYLAALAEVLAAFTAAAEVQGLEAEIVWRKPKPIKLSRPCRCRR